MSIKLTQGALRAMMPNAPLAYIDALVEHQDDLAAVGALDSAARVAFLFANVAEESGEFHEVVENIRYSPVRAIQVWPSRFGSISQVYSKTGSFPGDPNFPSKLMDYVYGNRMGNRPGTNDGSHYIGRGALQLTGREEYGKIAAATGLDLLNHPELATLPENQAAIMAAYIKLRNLNKWADANNFTQYVKVINGGTIGMSMRRSYLAHILPIANALSDGTIGPDHSLLALQKALNKLNSAGLVEDGRGGPLTAAATKAFQEAHGLGPDGIAGPRTWKVIDDLMRPTNAPTPTS